MQLGTVASQLGSVAAQPAVVWTIGEFGRIRCICVDHARDALEPDHARDELEVTAPECDCEDS